MQEKSVKRKKNMVSATFYLKKTTEKNIQKSLWKQCVPRDWIYHLSTDNSGYFTGILSMRA